MQKENISPPRAKTNTNIWYHPGRFSITYTTTLYKNEPEIYQKPPTNTDTYLLYTLCVCLPSVCLRDVPYKTVFSYTHTNVQRSDGN